MNVEATEWTLEGRFYIWASEDILDAHLYETLLRGSVRCQVRILWWRCEWAEPRIKRKLVEYERTGFYITYESRWEDVEYPQYLVRYKVAGTKSGVEAFRKHVTST